MTHIGYRYGRADCYLYLIIAKAKGGGPGVNMVVELGLFIIKVAKYVFTSAHPDLVLMLKELLTIKTKGGSFC